MKENQWSRKKNKKRHPATIDREGKEISLSVRGLSERL
jgi:hypothetical protein